MVLPPSFYQGQPVTELASQLLGCVLFSNVDGDVTAGKIVETEAYWGPEDRGSHAWNGRRTPRNEIMYAAGGLLYMYICYGIHDMVNIVTGPEGSSDALLIRALEPTEGIERMRERRQVHHDDQRLCKGPGALAQAMGLKKTHNGASLQGPFAWIERGPDAVSSTEIAASPRIGMNFEGPYQLVPWRFYLRNNAFVSRNKS